MKKINPLLVGIFVAAAVAVIGYAYTIFSDRYGKKSEEAINSNENSVIDNISNYLSGQNNGNANENQNGNENVNQNINGNANANTNASSLNRSDISSKDCKNDCVDFKGNEENYRYCQQVCGDIPASKKESEQECANLSGLEKDYCYRDLAVSKKDSSICGKISDQKLQSVCRNRVTEEVLN